MKITYTGRHEDIPLKQRQKFEIKINKLSKMLERSRNGERELHVYLSQQRHLHKAEITLNAFDHSLVCNGVNGEIGHALNEAAEKFEKQVVKMRTKWRDTTRKADTSVAETVPAPPKAKAAAGSKSKSPKVFRVDHRENGRKPMTAEEALLEMGKAQDYLVYRDAKTNRVSVILRREDGNFDLVES
jgi:putative sigma-54 modulation protein